MSSSNKAEKKHIVFVGKRKVGKSSLINTFVGKEVCTVDEAAGIRGKKLEIAMELPPYGAVILVDTFDIDYVSEDGQKQIDKIIHSLSSADLVVVVLDARDKLIQEEKNIFHQLKNSAIPFLAAVNKIEFGINSELINGLRAFNIVHFEVSSKENVGIDALKTRITRLLPLESIGSPSVQK